MDNIKELKGDWWTAPAEADDGRLIMVTGRRDIKKFRDNPRFDKRVEVTWKYTPTDEGGMPSVADSSLMEQAQSALTDAFDRDPVAVLTGIFTGDGSRDWVFYTLSTHIFGRKLNEALAALPELPISIYCENDADWAAYDEMRECEIRADD